MNGGAAELGAGMDAGMRKFIEQDQIAGPDQCRNDADIGEIARTEHARRVGSFERRQPALELLIERMIAGHEARRPGAGAIPRRRVRGSRNDGRMLTEVEIIVAGKRQQTLAVAFGPNSVACRDDRRAAKLRRVQRRELYPGEIVKRTHRLFLRIPAGEPWTQEPT